MKTRNQTQSSPRNDPINHRIHGFSFCDFEDEDGVQDMISPYPLDQFSISNTPQTQKRVKKGKKSIDSQIVVFRYFDFTQKSKGEFRFTKNTLIYRKIGCNSHIWTSIAINGSDEASLGKSVRLNGDHPIGDERLRCFHVAWRKRRVVLSLLLDLHRMVMVSPCVARWVVKIVT